MTSFEILDIDGDKQLNVMNLLTLYNSLEDGCKQRQELFYVIEFFLEKILYNKSILTKYVVNKDVYMKCSHNKPCLTDEIRRCFLGIAAPGQPELLDSDE